MIELSPNAYLWVKALHIIGIIAWMAALLYLPRLFVYHAQVEPESESSETFKVMEKRLLHMIMNPAATVSIVFGGVLLADLGAEELASGWLKVKMAAVAGLLFAHALMVFWGRGFARNENDHSPKFYRIMNEMPTILMIVIVIAVVVKPL